MPSKKTADVNSLMTFPVLVIKRNIFFLFSDVDHFTTGRREALVRGGYKNLFVFDSEGYGVSIIDAKNLHGIGLFRGWDLLGGQKIRLDYRYADDRRQFSIEEIRECILECFSRRKKWEDHANLGEFKSRISQARNMNEVIQSLAAFGRINSKWY